MTLFHTCDRVLVEHLTFQLGRDLGHPGGRVARARDGSVRLGADRRRQPGARASASARRARRAASRRAFAPHGAAALEAALADVPDAVIAPLDLSLIDAPKLAEILRANPRAQGVRFIFLGRVPDARARRELLRRGAARRRPTPRRSRSASSRSSAARAHGRRPGATARPTASSRASSRRSRSPTCSSSST